MAMAEFDLVVTGTVVTADRIIENGYVAVRDGIVEAVGQGAPPAAAERHDFGASYLMPGAIDSQVHSRSQKDQDDFIWSTRSAAAGGVTTIVDMPFDAGFLVCNGERITQKAKEAAAQARVDFALYGTIAPREGVREITGMVAADACGFKFSTFNTDPERFPRIRPQMLYACFSAIAHHDLAAGIHNENDEMVRAAIADVEASGITDYRAQSLSRPAVAETLAMAEVYELGAQSGCSTHGVHPLPGPG